MKNKKGQTGKENATKATTRRAETVHHEERKMFAIATEEEQERSF